MRYGTLQYFLFYIWSTVLASYDDTSGNCNPFIGWFCLFRYISIERPS